MNNQNYFKQIAEQEKAASKDAPISVEPETDPKKVSSGSGDKVVDALLESSNDLSLSEEVRLFIHRMLAKIFGSSI